jgi:hypothetical protein
MDDEIDMARGAVGQVMWKYFHILNSWAAEEMKPVPGGETEQRIFLQRSRASDPCLDGSPTHIGNGLPDDLYAEARKGFSEKELIDVTWAAAAINVWNRVLLGTAAA